MLIAPPIGTTRAPSAARSRRVARAATAYWSLTPSTSTTDRRPWAASCTADVAAAGAARIAIRGPCDHRRRNCSMSRTHRSLAAVTARRHAVYAGRRSATSSGLSHSSRSVRRRRFDGVDQVSYEPSNGAANRISNGYIVNRAMSSQDSSISSQRAPSATTENGRTAIGRAFRPAARQPFPRVRHPHPPEARYGYRSPTWLP